MGGRVGVSWTHVYFLRRNQTRTFSSLILFPYPFGIKAAAGDLLEAVEGREEGQLLHDRVLDLGVVEDGLRRRREEVIS